MLDFFLNGRLLPHNSIKLFSDIGEDSNALYCLTNNEQCCSGPPGARYGLWRFPEGDDVSNDKNIADVYIRRGFSSIRLNRKRNVMMPIGIYTCLIPNSGGSNSTLQIGIYSNISQGELLMSTWKICQALFN